MPDHPDMQRMQQEAVRRAMEMQSRARPGPEIRVPESRQRQQSDPRRRNAGANTPPVRTPQPKAAVSPPASGQRQAARGPAPPAEIPEAPQPQAQEGLSSAGEIFDLLFQDSERNLILGLILLLSSEKADPALIFALMYLAM